MVTIPLRLGRRKTTLPEPPRVVQARTSSAFSIAMKREFTDVIKDEMRATNRVFWGEPDPWDEAVKRIEAMHAAREEWPWPT